MHVLKILANLYESQNSCSYYSRESTVVTKINSQKTFAAWFFDKIFDNEWNLTSVV